MERGREYYIDEVGKVNWMRLFGPEKILVDEDFEDLKFEGSLYKGEKKIGYLYGKR